MEKNTKMSLVARKPNFGLSKTKAVQTQKMARFLAIRILNVEGLLNLCSDNNVADQLCLIFLMARLKYASIANEKPVKLFIVG